MQSSSFKDKIDLDRLPTHVAIIMDGNGRWAQQQGKPREFGHKNGVESVRAATEAAAELGIRYLTLYAFSTENWNRPPAEVAALMSLLVVAIHNELPTLQKNNIRLAAIGDLESLPLTAQQQLQDAIRATANNSRMTLVLALSYSAKWEMTRAVRLIAQQVQNGNISIQSIDEQLIDTYLATKDIPDPELLIRTSGENRLSNFLLWQLAYAELYFTPVLWPDFRKEHLYEALYNFQHRERRFGQTSEQVNSPS